MESFRQGDRALNKFITEYEWDEDHLNHERLEKLQKHGETRWSQDGYITIDNVVFQRTGKFYDHTEGEPVWRQNLIYSFYTDDNDEDNPVKYLASNKIDAPRRTSFGAIPTGGESRRSSRIRSRI